MANSADPDQTAPLIWVYTVCPNLSVRKHRIITVNAKAISTKSIVVTAHIDEVPLSLTGLMNHKVK